MMLDMWLPHTKQLMARNKIRETKWNIFLLVKFYKIFRKTKQKGPFNLSNVLENKINKTRKPSYN